MEVSVFDRQSALSIPKEMVNGIVHEVIAAEKRQYEEAAVHFVDTAEICRMHAEFFDDPSPTDCISFPIDATEDCGYRVLGDVFVCPEVAIVYAQEHGSDPYYETTLYIVHGLLHLMGYDDIKDEDRAAMRTGEERHMQNLKSKSLILRTS